MSLILDGTNGLSDVDGTAAAPAIRGTDTNTGIFFPAADTIAFAEGGVESVRIDSSGNVGIGTSSITNPQGWGKVLQITNSGSSALYLNDGTANLSIAAYSGRFYFTNGAATQMVLDPSGNLLVGTTSNVAAPARAAIIGDATYGGLAVEAPGSGSGYPVWFRDTDATSASQQMVHFRRGASNVGYITTTNTATSYSSASDYRLKEDITPMTGALAKVALLKPCIYKWKIDGSNGQGFIAHELQAVVPDCVSGEKDAVDAEGNPQYQGIDTSFLVATLTAAIQEQQALITALTTRITALEAA